MGLMNACRVVAVRSAKSTLYTCARIARTNIWVRHARARTHTHTPLGSESLAVTKLKSRQSKHKLPSFNILAADKGLDSNLETGQARPCVLSVWQ